MGFSDLNIHLIDILVIGLLAFGAYRGYMNGAIVQALDLFTLILGFIVVIYATNKIYFIFVVQGLNAADLFASLFLAALFTAAMWMSHVVQIKTAQKLADLKKTLSERLWGLFFGVLKYLLIVGVFMVTVKEIDRYTNFLPRAEKIAPEKGRYRSIMGTAAYYAVTAVVPSLKFEYNKPEAPAKKKRHKYVEPKSLDFNDDDF